MKRYADIKSIFIIEFSIWSHSGTWDNSWFWWTPSSSEYRW